MGRADRRRQPHRARARHRRLSVQRRPLGSDGLRSSADVLGAGRRAGRCRGPAGVRPAAASRSPRPRADVPARHGSARRVAARGARQQRLQAAVGRRDCRRRRDVSRRQLADQGAEGRAVARGVRQVGRSRRFRSTARAGAHRHRRLDLGGLREGSREAACGGEVRPRCRGAARTRRGSARATGRLPVRRSVYRDYPAFREEPFAFFGQMLSAARARPAVPIYNAISRELQLAIGYAIEGTRTPEEAVDDAWRVVVAEDTAATHELVARRTRSIRWRGCRCCSRWFSRGVALHAAGGRSLRYWLAPAIALVAVFLLYPILELVRIAFTDLAAPGGPYRYTLHGFRALVRRSAVLRDDWRHAGLRRRVGRAAAWPRSAAGVAVRRRRTAARRWARWRRASPWSAPG